MVRGKGAPANLDTHRDCTLYLCSSPGGTRVASVVEFWPISITSTKHSWGEPSQLEWIVGTPMQDVSMGCSCCRFSLTLPAGKASPSTDGVSSFSSSSSSSSSSLSLSLPPLDLLIPLLPPLLRLLLLLLLISFHSPPAFSVGLIGVRNHPRYACMRPGDRSHQLTNPPTHQPTPQPITTHHSLFHLIPHP